MSCTGPRNIKNNSPWLLILHGHGDKTGVNVHFFFKPELKKKKKDTFLFKEQSCRKYTNSTKR